MKMEKNQKFSTNLDFLDQQNSQARSRTIGYVSESNCRRVNLLIEALLAEIKSVVTEKEDVEHRDEEKSLAQLEFPHKPNSEARITMIEPLYEKILQKFQALN